MLMVRRELLKLPAMLSHLMMKKRFSLRTEMLGRGSKRKTLIKERGKSISLQGT
jgi:hypothetical protein